MKFRSLLMVLLAVTYGSSLAQDSVDTPNLCAAETARMSASRDAYQSAINKSQQNEQSEEPPPAAACLGGKLQWKLKKFSLDIPVFQMKVQKWSTKVPQIKMSTRSFNVPRQEIKCENRTVGWTPTLTCNWKGCTAGTKPIVTRVCWPESHSHEIKMGVPNVEMKNQDISISIPETKMARKDLSFKYPEFYAGEGCIGGSCEQVCEDITKKQVEEQQAALSQATAPALREMNDATDANFTCIANNMQLQRTKVSDSYESWINVATQTMQAMIKEGLNDAATEQSTVIAKMRADRDSALIQLDEEIKKVATEQKALAEKMASLPTQINPQ